MTEPARLNLPFYPRREAMTLALLTGIAIVGFVAVTGLSRLYQSQQQSLAERWASRGAADLRAQQYAAAATDFRAALLHARDSDAYELSLAQALLGMNRTDEAYAYFLNLWDHEPENGLVNLNLARIAAQKGDTQRALRFYHNAIYATWPGNQESASRGARIELIDYLLRNKNVAQAQAELFALSANLSERSPEQEQAGALFLRAQDPQHALNAFRLALHQNSSNEAALAGAGAAAFQLGLYPVAEEYLQMALRISPGDGATADRLRKTESVLALDPYRPRISEAERDTAVVKAFATVGDRLKTCASRGGSAATEMQDLSQQWDKLNPQITETRLQHDPDLADTAMSLAFSIENKSAGACGPPSDSDAALVLIANSQEEE